MQCESILLIARCFVSQINVALYSISQSIELQEINYLALLPKAYDKVAIFAASCKKAFYNRMIRDIKWYRWNMETQERIVST